MFKVLCKYIDTVIVWLHYSPYQPGGAGSTQASCWWHIGTVMKKDSELQQTDCRLRVIAAVFLYYVNVTM